MKPLMKTKATKPELKIIQLLTLSKDFVLTHRSKQQTDINRAIVSYLPKRI